MRDGRHPQLMARLDRTVELALQIEERELDGGGG